MINFSVDNPSPIGDPADLINSPADLINFFKEPDRAQPFKDLSEVGYTQQGQRKALDLLAERVSGAQPASVQRA
ncbi:MAG TPA: hypothetical protein VK009_16475, partial [Chloroflexota bacterium]|nr:hypothetical protein [Chloroflexota bacterium]